MGSQKTNKTLHPPHPQPHNKQRCTNIDGPGFFPCSSIYIKFKSTNRQSSMQFSFFSFDEMLMIQDSQLATKYESKMIHNCSNENPIPYFQDDDVKKLFHALSYQWWKMNQCVVENKIPSHHASNLNPRKMRVASILQPYILHPSSLIIHQWSSFNHEFLSILCKQKGTNRFNIRHHLL